MIGIDTNVLLRFLVRDDNQSQHEAAVAFMKARSADDPAYVSFVVLAETVWVLRRRLGFSMRAIAMAMRQLLASCDLVFEEQDFLRELFSREELPGADIADHLIAWAHARAGCAYTVTFDGDATAHVEGMRALG